MNVGLGRALGEVSLVASLKNWEAYGAFHEFGILAKNRIPVVLLGDSQLLDANFVVKEECELKTLRFADDRVVHDWNSARTVARGA